MNDEEHEREREQIRREFPMSVRERELDDSVWWALETFWAAVERCRRIARPIEGERLECELDFGFADDWDFNAYAGPSWGKVTFHCGVPLALWDASISLAHVGVLPGYEHPPKSYQACGRKASVFVPACAGVIQGPPDLPAAGGLFKAAARFITNHEVAHLVLGHVFLRQGRRTESLLVMEYQADAFALDLCTSPHALAGLPGKDDVERWRIAVTGALMAFAVIGQLEGRPAGDQYARTHPVAQTRWLTLLWVMFSKKYSQSLPREDPLWNQIFVDALAMKRLFKCDWLDPFPALLLYKEGAPTDDGMREVHRLTELSEAALAENGWQQECIRLAERSMREWPSRRKD